MTFSEQNRIRLEFEKDVEKRMRLTILVTRVIAVFLIVGLFFIGFVQLKAVNEYGKYKDMYGKEAWCYLCGLENYKKCECQYFIDYNEYLLADLDNYSKSLAEYNTRVCKNFVVQDGTYQYGYYPSQFNITFTED